MCRGVPSASWGAWDDHLLRFRGMGTGSGASCGELRVGRGWTRNSPQLVGWRVQARGNGQGTGGGRPNVGAPNENAERKRRRYERRDVTNACYGAWGDDLLRFRGDGERETRPGPPDSVAASAGGGARETVTSAGDGARREVRRG